MMLIKISIQYIGTCEVQNLIIFYLLTVLRSVDLPSLWNVIITDVAGRSSGYSWYWHLAKGK